MSVEYTDLGSTTGGVMRSKRFDRTYILSDEFKREIQRVVKDDLFKKYKFVNAADCKEIVESAGESLFNITSDKLTKTECQIVKWMKKCFTNRRIAVYRSFRKAYEGTCA